MAAFANMTIADSVPTNRTFEARSLTNGVANYAFPATSSVVGDHTVKMQHKPASQPDGLHKYEVTIRIPVVDAPAASGGYTPAPRVVQTTEVKLIFSMAGRGTLLDRQNALAYLKNLLLQAQFSDAVTSLSPPR